MSYEQLRGFIQNLKSWIPLAFPVIAMDEVQRRQIIPYQKPPASTKPPNVIVYSESSESIENIKKTLSNVLNVQRYTIYPLNLSQMSTSPWLNQASLVVVAGNVPASLIPRLQTYVTQANGKLLCICSDLIQTFLPDFQASENVADNSATTFSYSTWKNITLTRNARTYWKKSHGDEDDSNLCDKITNTTLNDYKLDVKVLSTDESILLATTPQGGKMLFSQVHLEGSSKTSHHLDLTQDATRLDILKDLLSTHLGLQCGQVMVEPEYTPGYLLGTKQAKQDFLDLLKDDGGGGDALKIDGNVYKFCKSKDTERMEKPSSNFSPIFADVESDSFKEDVYLKHLKTQKIGKALVHSKVMTSSMVWINALPGDGLAVVAYLQTRGVGRGGNTWLSPEGCAMYSVQLHIPLDSILGQHLPLLQIIVTLATVSGICAKPGLEKLDLRLKWPNDIYAGSGIKIGGAVVTSSSMNGVATCCPGVGVNLFNREPTTCVNEMIDELNRVAGTDVAPISFEEYFALTFTEMERLIDMVQSGRLEEVLELYYDFWLHSNARVTVLTPDGTKKPATILGIDEYGYLRMKDDNGDEFVVEHDGNSFDMLSGLIAPKV
ncbi:biotin--protein ligase [Nilaparvata lugens]|uniref:biotin--protein ligase n=1 Tax=Nilaparvata lugens TaxID=108931 RepID=UPI00193D46FA|nr:biotin--protein ligase [Nilaparvata lugens]